MGHGLIQSRGSEQKVHTLLTACSLLQGFKIFKFQTDDENVLHFCFLVFVLLPSGW